MADGGATPAAVLPEAPAERVRVLLERILEELGLAASVAVEEGDEEIHADIEGEDVGLLIGRHGQTIDAIQLLPIKPPSAAGRIGNGSRSMPRATGAARASRCAGAPTWPPRTPSGTARRSRWTRWDRPNGASSTSTSAIVPRSRPTARATSPTATWSSLLSSRIEPARASAEPALEALLELLAEPRAPISVASARRARDVHIADSLSGLEIESLASASRIADLGSGAGLPGLALGGLPPELPF